MKISSEKSRAEYFRERRKIMKQFVVMLNKEKFEQFERKLKEKGINQTTWLNQKIDEELGQ